MHGQKIEEEPEINFAKKIDGVVKPVLSHTNAWSKQEEETETNIAKEIDEVVNSVFSHTNA